MLNSYLSLFNYRKSGHSPNSMVIRTWGIHPWTNLCPFNLGESQKIWGWFPDTKVFLPAFHCELCIYFVLHIHPVKISHHHFPLIFKRDLVLLSAASIIVFILSAEIWWFISSAQTNFRLSILPCSSIKKNMHAKYTYLYLEQIVPHLVISLTQQASGDKTGLNYSLTLNTTSSSSSELPC